MKWNNIFHIAGAVGCILGTFALASYGWHIWQWPAIALLWIVNSYIHAWSAHRSNAEVERLHKDLMYNIEQLSKQELKTWEAEMKLAKQLDKK